VVGSNGKTFRLRAYAERLYRSTDLALVGRFGGPILETACDLLGTEEWHIRIASDRPFIVDLLDRIGSICAAQDLLGLDAAGDFIEVMKVSGEDLGMQGAPLYSPEVFRDLLLPPLARRWAAVKGWVASHRLEAKLMLHSCGAIRDFIPALLESGIEVLDPVQPLAKGMDPEGLRAAFGGKLVFHGGIDIQRLLPRGSTEEVTRGTRLCLAGFKAGEGGFIAAPSHAVQADVPPSNLRAMAETVRSWKGG
jgi:uroporphyrinogen decarboxylase